MAIARRRQASSALGLPELPLPGFLEGEPTGPQRPQQQEGQPGQLPKPQEPAPQTPPPEPAPTPPPAPAPPPPPPGVVGPTAPTPTPPPAPTAPATPALPPPPPGFDATKWNDPNHNTPKYVAGRMLAQGKSVQDVVATLGAGWKVLGPDTIEDPQGNIIDIYYDFSGMGTARPQWVVVGGPSVQAPTAAAPAPATPPATAPTTLPAAPPATPTTPPATPAPTTPTAPAPPTGGTEQFSPEEIQALLALLQSIGGGLTPPGGGGVFQPPTQQVGQDPLSQILSGGLAGLIGNEGALPFGQDVAATLADVIRRSAAPNPQDQLMRFESARELASKAQRSMMADARGALANRGLLSEPGSPQGSEITALQRIQEAIAPEFARAARDAYIAGQGQADQKLISALGLATGLAGDQAATFLNSIQAGTDRQRVLSEIALGTLDRNMAWNQFLAEFGLERSSVMEALLSGNINAIMPIINLFLQVAQQAAQGFVLGSD